MGSISTMPWTTLILNLLVNKTQSYLVWVTCFHTFSVNQCLQTSRNQLGRQLVDNSTPADLAVQPEILHLCWPVIISCGDTHSMQNLGISVRLLINVRVFLHDVLCHVPIFSGCNNTFFMLTWPRRKRSLNLVPRLRLSLLLYSAPLALQRPIKTRLWALMWQGGSKSVKSCCKQVSTPTPISLYRS